MKILASLLVIGATLATPALAEVTKIEVPAEATVVVPNDVVRFDIRDTTPRASTNAAAVRAGAKRVLELKKLLEENGLQQGTDFVVRDVHTWPDYGEGRTILGYSAHFSAEVVITHSNEHSDDIYRAIGTAKFKAESPVDGLSRGGEKKARQQARADMFAVAEENAAAFAAGIRCKLGDVISVKEGGEHTYRPQYESARGMRSSSGPVSDTVAAERMTTVRASAVYTFACAK